MACNAQAMRECLFHAIQYGISSKNFNNESIRLVTQVAECVSKDKS